MAENPITALFADVADGREGADERLTVFWGASTEGIGDALSISVSSVERDWHFSRRWLAMHLGTAGKALQNE